MRIPLDWRDKMLDAVMSVIGDTITWLINMIFEPIVKAIEQAITVVMGTIGTFWIYVPTPSVGNIDTGEPANGTVSWMWQHTQYIAWFVAVIGLLIGGIQMAWSQRGETARDLLRSLITLGMAALFSVGVAQALIEFGDKFSDCLVTTALSDGDKWVCGIGQGGGTKFGESIGVMIGIGAAVGPIGIGLAITIGILTVVAGVIQIVLMVVRSAMLILLLGVLPIAAAATNTEMGRGWFKRILSWLLAFILYKPVAAIVYATAIRLTSNNGEGLNITGDDVGAQIMNMVTGITMLMLALFALPALMRFIVPMVGATAAGAGAGMLAAKMVGMDKMAEKAQQGVDSNSGGDGGGPSGAQNVGRPSQAQSQGPSGGGGGDGGAGGAAGGEGGAAAAGGEGGAAAAAGGGGGGAAAAGGGGAAAAGAGGAGAGAAAAAGPAAAAAAPLAVIAAGTVATKKAGEAAAGETLGNEHMDAGSGGGGGGGGGGGAGGGGGGGGGGGPSGSGGYGDARQQSQRYDPGQQRDDDDRRRQNNQPPPPDSDGPRGSG